MSWRGILELERSVEVDTVQNDNTVYVVAEVWRGMASSVKVFRNFEDAQRYHEERHGVQNEHEEDVQVFETEVQ